MKHLLLLHGQVRQLGQTLLERNSVIHQAFPRHAYFSQIAYLNYFNRPDSFATISLKSNSKMHFAMP